MRTTAPAKRTLSALAAWPFSLLLLLLLLHVALLPHDGSSTADSRERSASIFSGRSVYFAAHAAVYEDMSFALNMNFAVTDADTTLTLSRCTFSAPVGIMFQNASIGSSGANDTFVRRVVRISQVVYSAPASSTPGGGSRFARLWDIPVCQSTSP